MSCLIPTLKIKELAAQFPNETVRSVTNLISSWQEDYNKSVEEIPSVKELKNYISEIRKPSLENSASEKIINISTNVNENDILYQLPQGREQEEFVASEKTVRDLVARMSNFDLFQNVDNSSPFEKLTYSEQQKLTKKIKDISEKQGDRIGIRNYDVYDLLIKQNRHKEAQEYKKNSLYLYKIINNKDEKYKGVTRISDGIIYINLAYATLDTPIHEILGHPIIRAIKNNNNSTLYQNLLEELEYGKGKEVLDRIKRDYDIKDFNIIENLLGSEIFKDKINALNTELKNIPEFPKIEDFKITKSKVLKSTSELSINGKSLGYIKRDVRYFYWHRPSGAVIKIGNSSNTHEAFRKVILKTLQKEFNLKYNISEISKKISRYSEKITVVKNAGDTSKGLYYLTNESGDNLGNYSLEELRTIIGEENLPKYTLEEQQEEAIVELLGLYTADRLDKVKDGKLISLLKRLLKEMKAFMKQLLGQKEVEIDKLPDNMTLGDIADLLAYSNSKLILPGNEVIYITSDNQRFKTYAEASNHISNLAKSGEDVDLSDITLDFSLSQKDLQEIEELEKQKKEKEDYFNSKAYQQYKETELDKLNKKFEELVNKKVEFYSQEPLLNLEDQEKYGFQDFDYVRVESTYRRGNIFHDDILGENYEGYYIHGYNISMGKPEKKILPITKEEAIKIWEKDEGSKYEVKDAQEMHRIKVDIRYLQEDRDIKSEISSIQQKIDNIKSGKNTIKNFIEKNKEYEQAKEIIEKWIRINNIRYNPEEVYSRGQGFYSIMGAYSNFELDLMLQNLLEHIKDNKIAGGEYVISATTDVPNHQHSKNALVTRNLGRNIYIKITPKSEDIKWATATDCYSGSVLETASEFSKDPNAKELLGVSQTKVPSLGYIHLVEPSLASAIENVQTYKRFNYNELGIELTGENFRLEYDENVPYTTKKLVDSINSILDEKYGKLVKPELSKIENKSTGIQPTQTNRTLKESIESVRIKLAEQNYKEYTSQALVNIIVAKLKNAPKKYQRSLIRSEVRPINSNSNLGFTKNESHFQKVSNDSFQQSQQELAKDNKDAKYQQLEESSKNSTPVKITDSFIEENLKAKGNQDAAQRWYISQLPEYLDNNLIDEQSIDYAKTLLNIIKNGDLTKNNGYELSDEFSEIVNKLIPYLRDISNRVLGMETKLILEGTLKASGENNESRTLDFIRHLKTQSYNEVRRIIINFAEYTLNPQFSISKQDKEQTIKLLNDFIVKYSNKSDQEIIFSQKSQQQIEELFKSNPELANAIYEALGFANVITSTDKIVWGHPAIGKTTMLESNPDAFIDWDNEFNRKRDSWIANKSNTVIGTPEFKKARNEYMINYNSHKDYVAFVKEEWGKAKEKANKENKTLIASPNILLNFFPNDFDKVITMSDKTFIDRDIKRSGGDGINSKLWKKGINETLKSVDKSRIIETDKYINDLFITPQQKQKAQQLYSSYLQTTNNPTIEGFKQWNNKQQQINELFESNPELANQIYEALGLTTINESEITYTDEDGNPCAKNGLTDTVKGTGWTIEKDLKGYKKHSDGGVDLSFDNGKVNFTRKDGKIHAKHGLLIINK